MLSQSVILSYGGWTIENMDVILLIYYCTHLQKYLHSIVLAEISQLFSHIWKVSNGIQWKPIKDDWMKAETNKRSDANPVSFRKYRCSDCYFQSIQYINVLWKSIKVYLFKNWKIWGLARGTATETEQSKVDKIKATNTKRNCKTNALVMVYLQSIHSVEAALGVATLAISSRSRIPNKLPWETNYWGVSWSWRFRYEGTLPIIRLKDFQNNRNWKWAYW